METPGLSHKFAMKNYLSLLCSTSLFNGLTAEELQTLLSQLGAVVRSYGKGELASMYIDGVQQQTAVKQFNEWIRTAPGLEQQLQETGMAPTARRYTPAQVRLIIGVLGTP